MPHPRRAAGRSASASPGGAPAPATTAGPAAIEIHDLTIAWRGHPVVHHLSGRFAAGRSTAVVGPNGAGKSSLLGALAGLVRPASGRIDCGAGRRVAYLPQAASIDRSFPLRIGEVVTMGRWHRLGSFRRAGPDDRRRMQDALAAVGLAGFESRLVGELSAGQWQRALFARVMLHDADLILLDEPFNAIDARTTADLLDVLARWRGESRTVIAVLHDLDQARRHFDEALLLAREPVAWGPVAEVLQPVPLARAREMSEAWEEPAVDCRRAA